MNMSVTKKKEKKDCQEGTDGFFSKSIVKLQRLFLLNH